MISLNFDTLHLSDCRAVKTASRVSDVPVTFTVTEGKESKSDRLTVPSTGRPLMTEDATQSLIPWVNAPAGSWMLMMIYTLVMSGGLKTTKLPDETESRRKEQIVSRVGCFCDPRPLREDVARVQGGGAAWRMWIGRT